MTGDKGGIIQEVRTEKMTPIWKGREMVQLIICIAQENVKKEEYKKLKKCEYR